MSQIYQYVMNSLEIGQMGWTLLLVIGAPMIYMLFHYVNHWAFRIVAAPSMLLGAAVCNAAMNDLALHFTTDKTINQGIGFGAGMVLVMLTMSLIFWCWYEFADK